MTTHHPADDFPNPPAARMVGDSSVKDTSLKKPDITPAQIVGLIPVVAALLAAFGIYDLTPEQQEALENATTAGLALFGADAIIRFGRSLYARKA